MKMSTKDDYKAVENFIFVSPAPADTAAKLSSIYRFTFVALKKAKFDFNKKLVLHYHLFP